MMQLKSCPRCHGDMIEEKMLGEAELVCLQCGHRSFPQPAATRLAAPPTREAPSLRRAA